MELKDFVKTTITQISEAILEVQADNQDNGLIVNPQGLATGSKGDHHLRTGGWRYVQAIEFDVALSVTENSGKDGKLTVRTGFIDASLGGKGGGQNNTTTSLKFKIPVAFPGKETSGGYDRGLQGIENL